MRNRKKRIVYNIHTAHSDKTPVLPKYQKGMINRVDEVAQKRFYYGQVAKERFISRNK